MVWIHRNLFQHRSHRHCFSSSAESFSLDEQDVEENFDLALLDTLETSVVPYLGDERLPDTLVSHLGRILHQGSRLYGQNTPLDDLNGILPIESGSNEASLANGDSNYKSKTKSYHHVTTEYGLGSTDLGAPVPRERFSYWCFDLLFLICSEGRFTAFVTCLCVDAVRQILSGPDDA